MNAVHLRARHRLQLLQGAKELFDAVVHAIAHSRHEVRLESYIFAFDEQGQAVAAALERAALRGVQVYLVVDGIGTPPLPAQWTARFDAAGVHWHRFSPLGWLGVFFPVRWRRLHRKLCVVDGQVAFCGGINVMDDFYDLRLGPLDAARLDFAVQVQGPLVHDAQALMQRFWSRLDFAHGLESRQWSKARSQLQTALRPQPGPITVRSACSHHFCPVIGSIWIGVLPNEHTNVIGLSKYARLAEWVMGRPQIPEEAVVQLADLIQEKTQPDGLAIVMEASHFCMSWRGVKDMDSKMINSVMRGVFLKDPNLRREFLSLIPKKG